MEKNSNTRKLTDAEFIAALRETGGYYARTAKLIEQKYGVPFTRQSVRERAKNFSTDLNDMRAEEIEDAKEVMRDCFIQTDDWNLRFKAAKYTLDNLGRFEGYGKYGVEKPGEQVEQVFEIGGKIIRF